MIIEVYINYTKAILKGSTPYGPSPISMRRRLGSREDSIFTVAETYSDLTPEEEKVVKTIQEYANEHGIEYKIHDISRTGERFKASLKGIKESPTVRIGDILFAGGITKEEIILAIGK